MRDFIASPFMLLMFTFAWVAGIVSGRMVIVAVESDEDNEEDEDYDY